MNHLKDAMRIMQIDIRDRLLNQAVRAAFYEALRWESDHPERNSQERYRAESELHETYARMFASYESALREQNGMLLEEVSRLRNLAFQPSIVTSNSRQDAMRSMNEAETTAWLNGDWNAGKAPKL